MSPDFLCPASPPLNFLPLFSGLKKASLVVSFDTWGAVDALLEVAAPTLEVLELRGDIGSCLARHPYPRLKKLTVASDFEDSSFWEDLRAENLEAISALNTPLAHLQLLKNGTRLQELGFSAADAIPDAIPDATRDILCSLRALTMTNAHPGALYSVLDMNSYPQLEELCIRGATLSRIDTFAIGCMGNLAPRLKKVSLLQIKSSSEELRSLLFRPYHALEELVVDLEHNVYISVKNPGVVRCVFKVAPSIISDDLFMNLHVGGDLLVDAGIDGIHDEALLESAMQRMQACVHYGHMKSLSGNLSFLCRPDQLDHLHATYSVRCVSSIDIL